MTRERPILFSGEMVRAILAGRKTQTRRAVKPQDMVRAAVDGPELWTGFLGWQAGEALLADPTLSTNKQTHCPYGRRGDRLWVRETWCDDFIPHEDGPEYGRRHVGYLYAADPGEKGPWRPSIHMSRVASRISLTLTNVRIERLQEISEADAIAEGIERIDDPRAVAWKSYEVIHSGRYKGKPHPHAAVPNKSPLTSYRELWESINGPGSWALNPWVWCLSFERVNTTSGVTSVE